MKLFGAALALLAGLIAVGAAIPGTFNHGVACRLHQDMLCADCLTAVRCTPAALTCAPPRDQSFPVPLLEIAFLADITQHIGFICSWRSPPDRYCLVDTCDPSPPCHKLDTATPVSQLCGELDDLF